MNFPDFVLFMGLLVVFSWGRTSHANPEITACSSPSGAFLTGSSGLFSSPNFPNNFPPNSKCTWKITVPSGFIIKVSFFTFTLEPFQNTDCSGGAQGARVFITNVASDDGAQEFKLCGEFLPHPVYSLGNSIQVRFVSLDNVYPGFNASYEAIAPQELCPNTILTKTSGVISSPFYPRKYPDNQACRWQLKAVAGKYIRLIVESIKIQQCGPIGACTCDYLEVQNGLSADGTAASGRKCGDQGSMTFYSIGESLTVLFVSDGSATKQFDGFRATYSQVSSTPVAGNFTNWGPWGACSSSCGVGTQIRFRTCTNPPPSNNGADCQGPQTETRSCNAGPCSVDGNFTNWGPWGACSSSCGTGTQIRFRTCTNPPPSNNGADCQGPRNETRSCNAGTCSVDGNFTNWGPWGACSSSCGVGTQTRFRTCTNPPPHCQGPLKETRPCNVGSYPVFTNWGPWGSCSSSCGAGIQVRVRVCTNPPPINGFTFDCQGPRSETQPCNVGPHRFATSPKLSKIWLCMSMF